MSWAEKLLEPTIFIHQVTIEFRFRKSLAQERFKSNLEFRYQIIVSSIKFRKVFAKFMIPIALFKKFLSAFIVSVEVSNMPVQGWTQRGCLRGHWKAKAWTEAGGGGGVWEGVEPPLIGGGPEDLPPIQFFFNLCLWECIWSHFEAHFSIINSITSILRKVRHANTLFLTISFAFSCCPLCALVRFPCGGGGGGAQQLLCKSESA